MSIAVILFNLGGPDTPQAIKPFLFNLFYDKAIMRLPNPFRYGLAKFISAYREGKARDIYAHLGGSSPLLSQTQAQAKALESALGEGYKVFIAMRYWHPLTEETVQAVKEWNPDEIVLLPLYPQYSTTTTKSSLQEWMRCARKQDLKKPTRTICCYPHLPGFVDQIVEHIDSFFLKTQLDRPLRFLFSAHGLPEKIVRAGDPYVYQVEQSVQAVLKKLNKEIDHVVCYQSRVGPLTWIGPSTEEEIKRAANDEKDIVMIPISFVSEHSETLVELDIEYRELAQTCGVHHYHRLPTVTWGRVFINGLRDLVLNQETYDFQCPKEYCTCWKKQKENDSL